MKPALSDLLCAHVVGTRFEDLPAAAVEAAKRSFLDAIGVSLGASGLGEGIAAFADHAIAAGGEPESSIFGYEERVPAQLAALANGAMAHALDFEDAYDGAPLHPNAAGIPAALALAQARGGVSGRELLTAIAVGCDLTCRLALCLRTQAETFGWYPPPIFGAYGAVAAAGRVIGLSADQMRDAFSLALSQATCSGEIKHSPYSVMRAVRDAFSAQTGVLSALLAERGVTGFEHPFEGECGFFRLFANSDYDPAILTDDLGRRFLGAEVSYKLWPSCRGTHGFIEAALELRAAAPVEHIAVIEMRGDALQQMLCIPLESKRAPRTAIDAKFSSPFVVATALLRGEVTLDDFAPANLRDPAVLALAQKATHAIDGTHPTPAGGTLVLRLTDGRVLERRVEVPLGAPNRPVAWNALCDKFKACSARARRPVSAAQSETLARTIAAIEQFDDAAQAILATLERP